MTRRPLIFAITLFTLLFWSCAGWGDVAIVEKDWTIDIGDRAYGVQVIRCYNLSDGYFINEETAFVLGGRDVLILDDGSQKWLGVTLISVLIVSAVIWCRRRSFRKLAQQKILT